MRSCPHFDKITRMQITTFITITLLFNGSLNSFANNKQIPYTPETAYQKLLTVKQFAFGGVGVSGTTSQGELAFRAVLSSPNALQLFKTAFSQGTNECKLYALCGIRKFDAHLFDQYSKELIQSNPTVTTIGGCIIAPQDAQSVVRNISAGNYDRYISKK
jgi:hypothetical protein